MKILTTLMVLSCCSFSVAALADSYVCKSDDYNLSISEQLPPDENNFKGSTGDLTLSDGSALKLDCALDGTFYTSPGHPNELFHKMCKNIDKKYIVTVRSHRASQDEPWTTQAIIASSADGRLENLKILAKLNCEVSSSSTRISN